MGSIVDRGFNGILDPLGIGTTGIGLPGDSKDKKAAAGRYNGPTREQPGYPGYESTLDPSTGMLKGNLNIRGTKNEGMDSVRETALARPGSSPWERMQLERQQIGQSTQRGAMDQQMASQTAGAQSSLAMRGGLSSGASERLAGLGAQNAMTERQNINRQGEVDRLGISTAAEGQRLGAANNLASMEHGRSVFDITNANTEHQNAEAAKLAAYQERMKGWSAEQMAQGYANAPKGGKAKNG